MNKLRIDRLKRLANHLLNGQLGHKVFNFNTYNSGDEDENGCRTLGCAIGECPIVFPDEWEFNEQGEPVIKSLGEEVKYLAPARSALAYFGLDHKEYSELFIPGSLPYVTGIFLEGKVTKEQVAERILKFCNIKEQENE